MWLGTDGDFGKEDFEIFNAIVLYLSKTMCNNLLYSPSRAFLARNTGLQWCGLLSIATEACRKISLRGSVNAILILL